MEKWYPVQKIMWSMSFSLSVGLVAKCTVLVLGVRWVISGIGLETGACMAGFGVDVAVAVRSEMRRGCFDTWLIWAAMSIPEAEWPTTMTFYRALALI